MSNTHPILFSPPMVKAILRKRKSQTRRDSGLELINKNPNYYQYRGYLPDKNVHCFSKMCKNEWVGMEYIKCRFGKPGDILWVKEMYYAFGYWTKENNKYIFRDQTADCNKQYLYHENPPERIEKRFSSILGWHKRNSLFMPQSASRIRLQVDDIKVERLNDISYDDCIAEGIEWDNCGMNRDYSVQDPDCEGSYSFDSVEDSYKSLWELLNGKGSWQLNPWLFVPVFTRVDYCYKTGRPCKYSCQGLCKDAV